MATVVARGDDDALRVVYRNLPVDDSLVCRLTYADVDPIHTDTALVCRRVGVASRLIGPIRVDVTVTVAYGVHPPASLKHVSVQMQLATSVAGKTSMSVTVAIRFLIFTFTSSYQGHR